MAEKPKDHDKQKDKDPRDKGKKPDYRDYGFVRSFLKSHPAINRLVRQAVREGWTKDRLQGAVKETKFWRGLTTAQEKATLLESEKPKEYRRQIQISAKQVRDISTAMGVALSPAEAEKYARFAFRTGRSPAEITAHLAARGRFDVEHAQGEASVTVDNLRSTAAEYGLRMSDASLEGITRKALASGDAGRYVQGYTDMLREQAKTMWPGVSKMLDQGMTIRQILSPRLEMAAQELGEDPATFDMTDPKWTKALTGGENGGMMDQSQWLATIRTDKRYGWSKSINARNQAADFANQLIALMTGQGG